MNPLNVFQKMLLFFIMISLFSCDQDLDEDAPIESSIEEQIEEQILKKPMQYGEQKG